MILSRQDIDQIADTIISDFQGDMKAQFSQTDIDRLAEQYLRLSVRYIRLSKDGNLLGLTTYEAADVEIPLEYHTETVHLERDTILLERRFLRQHLSAREIRKNAHQRRFTLAHECAHQILFRLEPESIRENLRSRYSPHQTYACRDLKSKEDWNEWQADTLGAALLMPRATIIRYFNEYQDAQPLISYGGKYPNRERLAMTHLMNFFRVSQAALEIRLRHLGYLEACPRQHYYDPINIFI